MDKNESQYQADTKVLNAIKELMYSRRTYPFKMKVAQFLVDYLQLFHTTEISKRYQSKMCNLLSAYCVVMNDPDALPETRSFYKMKMDVIFEALLKDIYAMEGDIHSISLDVMKG